VASSDDLVIIRDHQTDVLSVTAAAAAAGVDGSLSAADLRHRIQQHGHVRVDVR